MPAAACDHREWIYPRGYEDDWGEWVQPEPYTRSLYEDIDIGRFKCTRCGHIGYYTGLWRDYFEKGIPCPGSDRVKRNNKE